MDTSKLKEFLQRDWQATKRNLFAKPSFFAVAPLLIVGAVLITRSYLSHRRFQAQTDAMERAVRAADQKADTALREADRFADEALRKQGLSDAQIQEIKMRAASNSPPKK